MEIHQARYFVALCETLNFTRAAERCNVAQPSLTRAIRLLEEEFGGPLFNRERNNTHLTELGRMMEPHLREVLSQAASAKARAKTFFELRTARLKLALSRGVALRLVGEPIRHFARDYPDTEIVLLEDDATRLRDALRQGEVEVVVLPLRPADIDDLHYHPLADDQMQVLVRPDHRFAERETVAVTDLVGEMVIAREGCLFVEAIERDLMARDSHLRPRVVAANSEWLPVLVEDGLGIAVTGANYGVPAGLVGRPVLGLRSERDVSLATKRGRLYSPPVKAFVEIALRRRPGSFARVA